MKYIPILKKHLVIHKSSIVEVQSFLQRNSLRFSYIDMRVDGYNIPPETNLSKKLKLSEYDGYLGSITDSRPRRKWPPVNWLYSHSYQIFFYFHKGILQDVKVRETIEAL